MKKIAIMIPFIIHGRELQVIKNIAKGISKYAIQHGDQIKVVFSYPKDGNYNIALDFGDLEKSGVALRETTWKVSSASEIMPVIKIMRANFPQVYPGYYVPYDDANNFFDCDYWLIIAGQIPAPIIPLKKYSCISFDFINRFTYQEGYKSHFINMFKTLQNAETVVVTTPLAKEDMITYAGIRKKRISVMDIGMGQINRSKDFSCKNPWSENYILLITNSVVGENYQKIIEALKLYYQYYDGSLDVALIGQNNHPTQEVYNQITNDFSIKDRILYVDRPSDDLFYGLLSKAKFLWNFNVNNYDMYSVLEAAYCGIPSLTLKHPTMEYLNSRFQLNLTYFDPNNIQAIAETIQLMEKVCSSILLSFHDQAIYQHLFDDYKPLYEICIKPCENNNFKRE